MSKRSVLLPILLVALLVLSGCFGRSSQNGAAEVVYDEVSALVERSPAVQVVPLGTGQVLPPYGQRVRAETAVLTLTLSSTQTDSAGRLAELQSALADLAQLAEEQGLTLAPPLSNQISGAYARSEETPANYTLEAGSLTLRLATPLTEQDQDLTAVLLRFNEFLTAVDLPETSVVTPATVTAELGDLTAVRQGLIAQVYGELADHQAAYEPAGEFQVAGLYDGLKLLPLSDVEYYVYLEPVISLNVP